MTPSLTPEQNALIAELSFEESYKQISDLADAMPQLVWIALNNGEVVYYNSRVREYAGAYKDDKGHWQWNGLLHEEDLEPTMAAFNKALSEGTPYQMEHRVKMTDGTMRWHLSRAFPHRDARGEVIRWFGTATDIHEQKLVQEKIKQAEERWRTTLEATEIGTWEYNPADETFFLSDVAKKIRGFSEEMESRFTMHRATFHPDDIDTVTSTLKEALDKAVEDSFVLEYRVLHTTSGEWRWLRSIGRVILDEKGKPARILGIMQDVTAQKEAQKKVQYLATLTLNIPDAVIGTDLNYAIVNWNKGAEALYGWKESEVLGLKVKEVLQTRFATPEEERAWLNDYPVTGHWRGEVLQVHKNGTPLVVQGSVAMIRDQHGNRVGNVAVNKDVTEQRRSEARLRESEEKFRVLTNSIPQIVWLSDATGGLAFLNDRWEMITGQKSTDALEQSMQMVHPDDVDRLTQKWMAALRNGEPMQYDYRLKQKDGSYHWYHCNTQPLRDTDGKISHWIGTAANIQHFKNASVILEQQVEERTIELRKLNTALERQAEELRRSNEDLQQFAHVASHDLKEPLRKIKTYGSRLVDEFGDILPPKALLYLEKMESAATRMSAMIDGVLGYSTLGITENRTEIVDLNEIFAQIQQDLEILFEHKNASLHCGQLPCLEGTQVLLYQLFYNLVGNALKFTRDDVPPQVRVSADVLPGVEAHASLHPHLSYARIMVSDNGIGFEQAHAEKIFRTFTRLHGKDRFEGTGLGLSLCQKIVERHQGIIYASGVVNEGASFTVILPMAEA